MIEKKIRSLRDVELKTVFGIHFLSEGEVKEIQFKDQRTFDALVQLGTFIEADVNEPVVKKIPVLLPEVTEEKLVAVEPETPVLHDLKVPVILPDEAPEELVVPEEVAYWNRPENQKELADIEVTVSGTEKTCETPETDESIPDLPCPEEDRHRCADITEDDENPKFIEAEVSVDDVIMPYNFGAEVDAFEPVDIEAVEEPEIVDE